MSAQRSTLAAELEAGLHRITGSLGVGVDVEPVDSFRRLTYFENRRLYERLFTASEIAYCRSQGDPAQHFAARFAAKEAVLKAGGATLSLNVSEVEIVRTERGEPGVQIIAEAQPDPMPVSFRISLGHTHDVGYAVAIMMESANGHD